MKRVAVYENTDKEEAIKYAAKAAEVLVNLGVKCVVRPSLSQYLPYISRGL
ncbi:hypothetical protein MASR1M45_10040 [Candidatus Kapaibacterium sp.]